MYILHHRGAQSALQSLTFAFSHTHIQYARMHQREAAAMQPILGCVSCPTTLGRVQPKPTGNPSAVGGAAPPGWAAALVPKHD